MYTELLYMICAANLLTPVPVTGLRHHGYYAVTDRLRVTAAHSHTWHVIENEPGNNDLSIQVLIYMCILLLSFHQLCTFTICA